MKKRMVGFLFAIAFVVSFSACGDKEFTSVPVASVVSVSDSTSAVSASKENDVEPEVVEDEYDKCTLIRAVSFDAACVINEDGTLRYSVSLEDIDGSVRLYYDDKLLITAYDYSNDNCELIAYDLVSNTQTTLITAKHSIDLVDVYKGIIYASTIDYSDDYVHTEYALDAKTFEPVPANQDMYDEIKGYTVSDGMYGRKCTTSLERLYDEVGYVILNSQGNYYKYDRNSFEEYSFGEEESPLYFFDYDSNGVAIYADYNYADSCSELMVFEGSMDSSIKISNKLYRYIDYVDGVIYFIENEEESLGMGRASIYAYDTKDHTYVLLTKLSQPAGMTGYFPVLDGPAVFGDYVYYLDADNGQVNLTRIKRNSKKAALPEVAVAGVYSVDYASIAKVERIGAKVVCPFCANDILKIYYEYPVIDENLGAGMEAINKFLADTTQKDMEYRLEYFYIPEDSGECESAHEAFFGFNTSVCYVSNVRVLTDNLITVDLISDDYYGGAHGEQGRMHYLFDINTGKQVTMADLFGGSIDEYKEIVARAIQADFLSYSEEDSPYYYMYTDEEIYADSFDFVLFDYPTMEWKEDGVIIEVPPYVLGPYASGHIEVYISYADLSVSLY